MREAEQHDDKQHGSQGVHRLEKATLGPPPARVACIDCYDDALWGWRWAQGLWLCRDDDPLEDEINAFAYADEFDEDAFAYTDDFTAFD